MCNNEADAPIIEDLQLQIRMRIDGRYFEFSNVPIQNQMPEPQRLPTATAPSPISKATTATIPNTYSDTLPATRSEITSSPDEIIPLSPTQITPIADIGPNTPPTTGSPASPSGSAQTPNSIWQAYNAFIEERGKINDWKQTTYSKFEVARNLLYTFRPDLNFSHFDTNGLNDYIHFLCNTKNMCNTTVVNHWNFLKWFLRWSLDKGYHSCRDFDWFKPKLRKTTKKVIFLTDDELKRLQAFPIPRRKMYLERVRDVFLFCCFTGLRYSDVYNLKRSDVKKKTIEITTIKTADSLIIELNDQSRTILNKYKKMVFKDNKALPVISNQRMNAYLKELGELAALNEPVRRTYFKGNRRIDEVVPKYQLLATHVGRRTFVCNALSLGIPPEVVMKWTGHSDYAAMKPYIDIADKVKASAMRRFNRLTICTGQPDSDNRQPIICTGQPDSDNRQPIICTGQPDSDNRQPIICTGQSDPTPAV